MPIVVNHSNPGLIMGLAAMAGQNAYQRHREELALRAAGMQQQALQSQQGLMAQMLNRQADRQFDAWRMGNEQQFRERMQQQQDLRFDRQWDAQMERQREYQEAVNARAMERNQAMLDRAGIAADASVVNNQLRAIDMRLKAGWQFSPEQEAELQKMQSEVETLMSDPAVRDEDIPAMVAAFHAKRARILPMTPPDESAQERFDKAQVRAANGTIMVPDGRGGYREVPDPEAKRAELEGKAELQRLTIESKRREQRLNERKMLLEQVAKYNDMITAAMSPIRTVGPDGKDMPGQVDQQAVDMLKQMKAQAMAEMAELMSAPDGAEEQPQRTPGWSVRGPGAAPQPMPQQPPPPMPQPAPVPAPQRPNPLTPEREQKAQFAIAEIEKKWGRVPIEQWPPQIRHTYEALKATMPQANAPPGEPPPFAMPMGMQ